MRYPCEICGKITIGFHYGVNCCNACKQFFIRAVTSDKLPNHCSSKNGNCQKCRFCRYQLCLQAGLVAPSVKTFSPDLSKVLDHFKYLEFHRNDKFLNFIPSGTFNLDDSILAERVNYMEKPENFQPNFDTWVAVCFSTSVDFIKRCEVFEELSKCEKMSLVKQSYRMHGTFCLAMRSFSNRQEISQFPGGLDIIPQEIQSRYQNCPEILNRIKCPLVAKLRELKITNDEYLLLCALMICNTAPSIFSEFGQNHIGHYQKLFSSLLLQYCLQNYSKNGPSRFSDLLTIFYTIHGVLQDFDNAIIPFLYTQSKTETQKMLENVMEQKLD